MQRDYLGNPVGARAEITLRAIDDFIEGFLGYATRAARILAAAMRNAIYSRRSWPTRR